MKNKKPLIEGDMRAALPVGIIADRVLYVLAAVLMPSIVLFHLYNKNAEQGIQFMHCLYFGVALAVVSAVMFFIAARFIKYRRALFVMTLSWVAFWFFNQFHQTFKLTTNPKTTVLILLLIVCVFAFILCFIKINRLVPNTTALVLCLLFAFNFVPAISYTITRAEKIAETEQSGGVYEIKSEFNVDSVLPHPNIYWIHMDGMMGFDAVEKYFGDPQAELKNKLTEKGFIINPGARLEGGYTQCTTTALTNPLFYDTWLGNVVNRTQNLTRSNRQNSINAYAKDSGIDFVSILGRNELYSAFRKAGYVIVSNFSSDNINLPTGAEIELTSTYWTLNNEEVKRLNAKYNRLKDFVSLMTAASALKSLEQYINETLEKNDPKAGAEKYPIPPSQAAIDKYVTGNSDSRNSLVNMVRIMAYAVTIDSPHLVFFNNSTAHCINLNGINNIGNVVYPENIGRVFYLDENGNLPEEYREDVNDVKWYYPQYKWTVKTMMPLIELIIENDPDAVIVIQGDHGVHGIGKPGTPYYDEKYMDGLGYSLGEQLDMGLMVMSAVYIPEKFGKPDKPLDPLNISRWLINNFVGEGNYNYYENGGGY